jgi:beta-lactam-binding protein with PASTA domain
MDGTVIVVGVALVVGLVTFALGYMFRQFTAQTKIHKMQEDAESMLAQAKTRFQEAELEARSAALKIRDEVEQEIKTRRSELGVPASTAG